jgi:hypothetical protein
MYTYFKYDVYPYNKQIWYWGHGHVSGIQIVHYSRNLISEQVDFRMTIFIQLDQGVWMWLSTLTET